MKKVLVGTLAITLAFAGAAAAFDASDQEKVRSWDDLSWWGETGALPLPVKDSYRAGYWWWPTDPATADDGMDMALWGNRGVVYHMYAPAPPPEPVTPVTPPTTPTPPPTRQIPVLDNVLFDFDKAVLKPEGQAVVDRVVAELRAHENDTVTIIGHTDNIGTDAYNMALGQRRADAVASYMMDQGIAASRITTVSRGESDPAVDNSSAANRRLNRRVVFDYHLGN